MISLEKEPAPSPSPRAMGSDVLVVIRHADIQAAVEICGLGKLGFSLRDQMRGVHANWMVLALATRNSGPTDGEKRKKKKKKKRCVLVP
jgi:hypothetical protein